LVDLAQAEQNFGASVGDAKPEDPIPGLLGGAGRTLQSIE
jgi:hypothetical protein